MLLRVTLSGYYRYIRLFNDRQIEGSYIFQSLIMFSFTGYL